MFLDSDEETNGSARALSNAGRLGARISDPTLGRKLVWAITVARILRGEKI